MSDPEQARCSCLEGVPVDIDVCACGHPRSTHPHGRGRCRADDSYGARCTCDEYGSDLVSSDEDALGRPDHWECPHGYPTDGTHGHCDACDDLGVSDPR